MNSCGCVGDQFDCAWSQENPPAIDYSEERLKAAEREIASQEEIWGRMFSESFAGIAPASVPGFVVAELFGAGLAVLADSLLGPAQAAPRETGLSPSHRASHD